MAEETPTPRWVEVELLRDEAANLGLDVYRIPRVTANSSLEECEYVHARVKSALQRYHSTINGRTPNPYHEQFLMQKHDPLLRARSDRTTREVINGLLDGEKIAPVDGMVAFATIVEATAARFFATRGEKNLLDGFANQWAANAAGPATREKIDAMFRQK